MAGEETPSGEASPDPGASEQRPPESEGGQHAGWIVGVAVLLVGLALIFFSEDVPQPLVRGEMAPDFELQSLSGGERTRLSSLRGRVVLLNFWATWCKPCEDEMPAMERLYTRLAPEGFELLAVSVDETTEPVQAFRERMELSFPILLDPDKRASILYQTTGFPESLLLDPEGRIVERYVGPRVWDDPDYVERVRQLMVPPAG
jgi:peroxiredoxin